MERVDNSAVQLKHSELNELGCALKCKGVGYCSRNQAGRLLN